MQNKDKKHKIIPAVPNSMSGLGWDLFTASGYLGYYLLYHDLTDDAEDEERKFD